MLPQSPICAGANADGLNSLMPLRQYVANYMRVFYEVKCSLIDEPKVLGDRAENNDFGKQVRGGVDIFS